MTDAETQDDEYRHFLGDFGRQLDHGKRRAGHLRSRQRIATGGLALAAIAAAIIALASTGGGRVDVVAEAEAALAPPGQLLRIVTSSRLEMRGATHTEVTGHEAESLGWNKPRHAEEWSASTPTRWRIATTIPTATAQGSVPAAPLQCAYSNDSEETYNQGVSDQRTEHRARHQRPGRSLRGVALHEPGIERAGHRARGTHPYDARSRPTATRWHAAPSTVAASCD